MNWITFIKGCSGFGSSVRSCPVSSASGRDERDFNSTSASGRSSVVSIVSLVAPEIDETFFDMSSCMGMFARTSAPEFNNSALIIVENVVGLDCDVGEANGIGDVEYVGDFDVVGDVKGIDGDGVVPPFGQSV